MNDDLSPITKVSPTEEIENIPTDLIINGYKQLGLNVTRFFKGIDAISIRKCTVTDYRYYSPFNCMGDDLFYQDLQKASSDYYPINKWEHQKALEYIKPDFSILEIGCATGSFLSSCLQKGAKATGIELNQKAAAEAVSKGLNVSTVMLDEFAQQNQHQFDIVCSFQVLEHITDVNSYFNDAKKCLKPGGKLIIGVPNNNPYIFQHDKYHLLNLPPHHVGIWDKNSLRKTAEYFNYNIEFLGISPLNSNEYKEWYKTQVKYYEDKNIHFAYLLKIIPRPVYKFTIKCLSSFIEGKTLLTVLKQLPIS